MNTAELIYQRSLNLPEAAAQEALDFIDFLCGRYQESKQQEFVDCLMQIPNVGQDKDFERLDDVC